MIEEITPSQLRAARALLNLTLEEVADRSGVSAKTIGRLERAPGRILGRYHTTLAVQSAIEAAGVEFCDSDGVRRCTRGEEGSE